MGRLELCDNNSLDIYSRTYLPSELIKIRRISESFYNLYAVSKFPCHQMQVRQTGVRSGVLEGAKHTAVEGVRGGETVNLRLDI